MFIWRISFVIYMITDVYIVYDNDDTIKNLGDTLKVSPFFHFIDERTLKGKKDAFKLKSAWSSKLTPFALCTEGEKVVKAFYSEAEDVIKSLISYLNE